MPVKKVSKSMLSAPKEQEPVVEPVATPVADEVSDDTSSTTEEKSLTTELDSLNKLAKEASNLLAKFLKGSRVLSANIKKTERNLKRLDKRSKHKKEQKEGGSGNKGLQTPKPIYTAEMRAFIEKYHMLKDNEGNVIYENLQYTSNDEDKLLMASRDHVLKLATSYIRENGLKKYPDNKRRIMMDNELKAIYPTLCEQKDASGKVVREENCYYSTLMAANSRHFKDTEERAVYDAEQEAKYAAKAAATEVLATPAKTATPAKASSAKASPAAPAKTKVVKAPKAKAAKA